MDKKNLLLVVTGGIAAYKACEIASYFTKKDVNVDVVLTEHAKEFVGTLTFEAITKNQCLTSLFDGKSNDPVAHVNLARKADVVLVAPATANIMAKIANGIADDLASSVILACSCKKIIAPAMYTGMLNNPATVRNMETLRQDGWNIIKPGCGRLACGAVGDGRLADVSDIISFTEQKLFMTDILSGKKVLVTAGATEEKIDPVRFITNHSTGKMGYALARAAYRLGADVTLVSGASKLDPPSGAKVVNTISAKEMYDAVMEYKDETDIFIMAAAVADYTPKEYKDQKIKKSDSDLSLELVRTKDILKTVGETKRNGQIVIGFSMETENLEENSRKKLVSKNADMIVANSISTNKTGFGCDTNAAILITREDETDTGLMSKDELAELILKKAAVI